MKTLLSLIVVLVAGASLGGCARSLTPELAGISNRPADSRNMTKVTQNHNWRMVSDDIHRALYTDHPSRLSSYPIAYTSGMAR